ATANGELRVIGVAGNDDRALVSPANDTEVWGRAEFIAAEEMNRFRGCWWGPDGRSLQLARDDDADAPVRHRADAASPDRPSTEQRYPAAGTTNSTVTLWHVRLDGTAPTQVAWDHEAFEYLARVDWSEHGDPLIQVLTRDQRASLVLAVDPDTGQTRTLRTL